MLWLLVFTINLTQHGNRWNRCLRRELCGLAWLVGIFLVEFTEVERHALNVECGQHHFGSGPWTTQKIESQLNFGKHICIHSLLLTVAVICWFSLLLPEVPATMGCKLNL